MMRCSNIENIVLLFDKTSYLNEEVNSTESSNSVGFLGKGMDLEWKHITDNTQQTIAFKY